MGIETMGKRSMVWLAAVAAMAIGGSAGAAGEQQGSEPKPGERKVTIEETTQLSPEQLRTLSVTVMSVDRANHKVTFEAQVDPEASVQKDGQALRIDQLQPGDEVRASFDPNTGEVVKMEVVQMPAEQPSMEPAPSAPSQPSEPSEMNQPQP